MKRHLFSGLLSIFVIIVMAGCEVMHEVADASYRVVTAPVRMFTRDNDRPAPGTRVVTRTTTVVTRKTRVTTPLAAATPPPKPVKRPSSSRQRQSLATSSPTSAKRGPTTRRQVEAEATKRQTKPLPERRSSQPSAQFPVAKRVPEKPGYVVSPFDSKKRYVDVSGYTPGSKVKDPWTDKIFIVP